MIAAQAAIPNNGLKIKATTPTAINATPLCDVLSFSLAFGSGPAARDDSYYVHLRETAGD